MNAPMTLTPEAVAALEFVPGLQRYPVNEKRNAARATVEELHEFADMLGLGRNRQGVPVADIARRAAVLLDECQAGHYLFTPEAKSGWVLVPATLLPKVRATIEHFVSFCEREDWLIHTMPGDAEDVELDMHSAIAGWRAVLAVLEALEAQ